MIHCIKCGNITENRFVQGDSIKRDVCISCNHINYFNPKIIVGSLPIKSNLVLLCKRDILPSKGKWTIPSGFMELGESLEDGAKREAYEEANLEYEIIKLFGTYSIPSIGQVLFVYLGEIINENYRAASETSEVKLFNIDEIPWKNIAFPSVKFFLKKYVSDYKNDKKYGFHSNFSAL
tara:strand:- start:631 stop:1164 length:534 start_codon:yes stop_codon:yes gene_type:complete